MPPKRKQSEASTATGGDPQPKRPKSKAVEFADDEVEVVSDSELSGLHETDYLRMLEVKKSALLGYGIMSFADTKDMGRGLRVEFKKYNPRQATAAQIAALKAAVGADPNDPSKPYSCLNRFSPDNAMFMLIKSKYIDPDTLSKDPFSKRFGPVRWSDDVKSPDEGDVASLLNGNTRKELCASMGAPWIQQYLAIEVKYKKAKKGSNEHARLRDELRGAASLVRQHTTWLVAFFDEDVIHASPFRDEVLFELSKNRPSYQVPDSEAASLQLIINYLLSVPEKERLDKLQTASDTESHMLKGMQKRLVSIFRDSSLVMALVKLNAYKLFWGSKGPVISTIDKWRPSAAPFMESIILQGVSTFDYLASKTNVNAGVENVGQLRKKVAKRPPEAMPEVFNIAFFDILEQTYKKHLAKHISGFGITKSSHKEQEIWATALDAYWNDLVLRIDAWVIVRRNEINGLRNGTVEPELVNSILKRLRAGLFNVGPSQGLFNSTLFGMEFSTPPPLLCPSFLQDIGQSMVSLKPWIELAWRWIDFYALTKESIHMWFGATFSLMSVVERFKPVGDHLQLVRKINSAIFSMRGDILVKLSIQDGETKTNPKPPRFADLPMIGDVVPKDCIPQLVDSLKSWRSASIASIISERALRSLDLPENVENDILQLSGGDTMLNSLIQTTYPWAACPSNQLSGRLLAAAQNAVRALWLKHHQLATYVKEPAYWVLRDSISEILKANTTDFRGYWDRIENVHNVDPVMPPSQMGPSGVSTCERLSSQTKVIQVQSGLDKTVQAIIKALCTEDAAGVPQGIKPDFRPTGDVHKAAFHLFEALAVAGFHKQSAYLHPDQSPFAVVMSAEKKAELLSKLDVSDSFVPVSREDVKAYCRSLVAPESDTTLVGPPKVLVPDTPDQSQVPEKIASFPSPPVDGLPDEVLAQIDLFGDSECNMQAEKTFEIEEEEEDEDYWQASLSL